jgi:ribosomal protein L40E
MSLQLKTIATFATAAEAHIARNVLESEGIAAYLDFTNIAGALGLSGSIMCEVKLQVAEADQERARELLAQRTTHLQAIAGNSRICPKCGAKVPPDFEVCWSCQSPLGGDEESANSPSP